MTEQVRESPVQDRSAWTAERVNETFELDWERDYNFTSKEEFGRVKWREKGKRGRWHKVAVFTSDAHPSLDDLFEHRAWYVAGWLNMQAERKAAAS